MAKAGVASRNGLALLVPVIGVAIILSFAGRERTGVVEPHNLFTVTARTGFDAEFLSSSEFVRRGQTLIRFTSEAATHRLRALQARREEAVALHAAIAASELSISGILMARAQSVDQDIKQLSRKRNNLETAKLQAQQEIIKAETSWQRARNNLLAGVPQFEYAQSLAQVEVEVSGAAYKRIARLRERGYATVTQLETTRIAQSTARQRLESASASLESTRVKLEAIDSGYKRTRSALNAQLIFVNNEIAKSGTISKQLEEENDHLKVLIAADQTAAASRRKHELQAAKARILQLDKEISAVGAANEVRAPIAGRILYRSTTSSTLNGALPIMVVASDTGFIMRVDMADEESAILQAGAETGGSVRVLLDDTITQSLVSGHFMGAAQNPLAKGRATVIFALDVPEDMLVRMALKGTAPRGSLRWSPSPVQIAKHRLHALLGYSRHDQQIVRGKSERIAPKADSKAQAKTGLRYSHTL